MNNFIWPSNTYVLIAAYKAADSLTALFPQLLEITPPENICIVNDGSNDETQSVAEKFGIETLHHEQNQGKGKSLSDGFDFLISQKNAQWILTLDADGQHALGDVSLFLDYVKAFPDVGICIGRRTFSLGAMPFARIISNTLTSKILSIVTGQKIFDSQSGFRMYSAKLLKSVSCKYQRFEMESEIIIKASFHHFSIGFIKVQTLYLNDNSHIAPFKDTLRWLKAVWGVWKEMRTLSPK